MNENGMTRTQTRQWLGHEYALSNMITCAITREDEARVSIVLKTDSSLPVYGPVRNIISKAAASDRAGQRPFVKNIMEIA